MASVTTQANGGRLIQFMADGKRKSLSLGKVPMKTADEVKRRVELICNAKLTNTSLDNETAAWIAGIGDELAAKLAAVGLMQDRKPKPEDGPVLLGEFIDAYTEKRTDTKPGMKEVWRQGEMGLREFFGDDRPLPTVTPGDADEYRVWLSNKKAKSGRKISDHKLASLTVAKRLQFAKMIFRAALRKRLIGENPFAGVNVQTSMPENEHFVTHDDAYKLIAACSNGTWRSIVALARFGGLRCPSEVLSLRWQDIDWEQNKVTVQSPKTEHHPGKATRVIPLFPELRPYLQEAFEQAPDGAVHGVSDEMRKRANGPNGWVNCNLRTTMEKIVKRAGLTPWKRLFHNLRASRQTELEDRFPSHVVCKWMGNSESIARKHYLKVTDEHFAVATAERYAKFDASAMQKPMQSAAVRKSNERNKTTQVVTSKQVLPIVIAPDSLILSNKADGEGFEPPVPLRVRQFSRLLP